MKQRQWPETPCRWRRSNDNGRRHKNIGEEANTMVEDTKPSAESQRHRQSHNTVGGSAKNIREDTLPLSEAPKTLAERQNRSAKPCRPWSKTIAILLNNNTIRRQSILPMVEKALPMVEDTTKLAEKQRAWSMT
jgi:hypothetical protein